MHSFSDPTKYRQMGYRDVVDDALAIWGKFLDFVYGDRAARGLSPISESVIAEDILDPDIFISTYLSQFISFLAVESTLVPGRKSTDPRNTEVDVLIGKACFYVGPSWLQLDGNNRIVIHLNFDFFPDHATHNLRMANIAIIHELAHIRFHWDDSLNPLVVASAPSMAPAAKGYQDVHAWWWCMTIFSLLAGAIASDRPDQSVDDLTLRTSLMP